MIKSRLYCFTKNQQLNETELAALSFIRISYSFAHEDLRALSILFTHFASLSGYSLDGIFGLSK